MGDSDVGDDFRCRWQNSEYGVRRLCKKKVDINQNIQVSNIDVILD